MSQRIEVKFFISREDYMALANQLRLVMQVDKHATKNDGYHLTSMYFDDIYDSATYDKADGVEYHRKFRIRTYENGKKNLEYKTKNGDVTSKDILSIDDALEEALLSGNQDVLKAHLNESLIKQVFVKMKLNHLRPTLYIDYVREAYVYEPMNIRITFDQALMASRFTNPQMKYRVLEPNLLIMEVKYDHRLPTFIKKIIFQKKHQPIAYSKYLMGWLKLNNLGV